MVGYQHKRNCRFNLFCPTIFSKSCTWFVCSPIWKWSAL